MEQKNIDTSTLFDRLHASFAVFTRIPGIQGHTAKRIETAIAHWPLTGWTTGAAQALVLWAGSYYLPWALTVALAVLVRACICPHPKLLATRSMNLTLLIIFELLISALYLRMDTHTAVAIALAGGPYAHMVTSQMVAMLSYREDKETSMWHVAFRKYSTKAGLWLLAQGIVPLIIAVLVAGLDWYYLVFAPCVVMYFCYLLAIRQYGGYTVDLLLAVSALLEAVVYIVVG